MILQAIHLVVLSWILYFLWKRRVFYFAALKFKNDFWDFPLLGHGYMFFGSSEDRMNGWIRLGQTTIKHKGLSKMWLGPRFFVVVADPIHIEQLTKTSLEKDDMILISHELLGNGSIFAPVSIWRPRRKIIAPTFSQKNLNQFVNIFAAQSSVMVKNLKQKSSRSDFSIWKYLTCYSMDSICETALGVKVNAQEKADHPFLIAFETHCRNASFRLCQPTITQQIYKYLPSYVEYMKPVKYLTQFVDKIIEDKRRTMNAMNHSTPDFQPYDKPKTKSFLEMYINCSGGESGFTNLELREESLVLVLAGTDTSAVGAAFTSLMLSLHPEVQDKVYEELKEVLGESNRAITAEDLPRLKYLEMVVKESLRLYPPVPIIVRKTDKDVQLNNGLTIPKDSGILIHIWATHRNPAIWGSDAEQFRPERFIDSVPDHPAAFIPFSTGPRSCLGYQYAMMSMKTVVATLVRNYKLLPSTSLDNKTPLRLRFDVMMKHVNNFELQIEPRN